MVHGILFSCFYDTPWSSYVQIQPINHYFINFSSWSLHGSASFQLAFWWLSELVYTLLVYPEWRNLHYTMDCFLLSNNDTWYFRTGCSLSTIVLMCLDRKISQRDNDLQYVNYLPDGMENRLDQIHNHVEKLINKYANNEDQKN